ncbi:MAG: GntR family transcriptional regulator, partial [Treponema sp.]|nr:GntR family transcriptional regulator [Treponema sp.]
ILNCDYPPNFFLNEEKLREEIKMSRTPIRDALGRLEQEHLVKIYPKKGFRITDIKNEEIEKIFELRMLIEPYALLKFGCEIDMETWKDFEVFYSQHYDSASQKKIFARDDKFHHLFIDASKNQYLIHFYNSLFNQLSRLRFLSGYNKFQRLREGKKEHLAILRFCVKKDWTKAADSLRMHLERSKESAYNIKFDG